MHEAQLMQVQDGHQYISLVQMPDGQHQQLAYWPTESAQQHGGALLVDRNPAVRTSRHIPNLMGTIAGANDAPVQTASSSNHFGNRQQREKAGRGRRSHRNVSDGKICPSSSPLLDDFRASKNRDWTLFQIQGHVVDFCQDQNGSRFIQQRLEMGDLGEQQVIVKEVLPAIRRLRNDVFGNYVVQKLLDFGTSPVKSEICRTLEGEMLQLSLQMYGCRVVQKALETLDESDIPRLLNELHYNVLSCIHDQNGNHVIQKCIEVMHVKASKLRNGRDLKGAQYMMDQIEFIIQDVLNNTTTLAVHAYGCRVLQRILEHCEAEKKELVLNEIKKSHKRLLDDQYGNYVIQHVLQYGRPEDRDSILAIVVSTGLLGLSRQKFASNVVEKLLKYGNGTQRRVIMREMLKMSDDATVVPSGKPNNASSVALLMVRDAYANYVVQTTLDVAPESDERRLLLKELNLHVEELRNYTFAKHIVSKLASMSISG